MCVAIDRGRIGDRRVRRRDPQRLRLLPRSFLRPAAPRSTSRSDFSARYPLCGSEPYYPDGIPRTGPARRCGRAVRSGLGDGQHVGRSWFFLLSGPACRDDSHFLHALGAGVDAVGAVDAPGRAVISLSLGKDETLDAIQSRKWIADSNERILVTGAAGFIGLRVVDRLLRSGFREHRVFCPTHQRYQGARAAAVWLPGTSRGNHCRKSAVPTGLRPRGGRGRRGCASGDGSRKVLSRLLPKFGRRDAQPSRRDQAARVPAPVRQRQLICGLLKSRAESRRGIR